MQRNKDRKVSFDEYYENIYSDKWAILKASLELPENQIIRSCFNAKSLNPEDELCGEATYTLDFKGKDQVKNSDGRREYYVMDAASYLSAKQLTINPDDHVLDMCAAPGGKSLILLEQLDHGILWANEISKTRRDRLTHVIRDYVPEALRQQVFVKGKDAIQYGIQTPEMFDKILLDAPCSSERHLLKNPVEMLKWSPKRTKKLSALQYGLLCSALLACKPGGEILYSTCSISPLENDGVIDKAIKKKGSSFEVIPLEIKGFEKTKYGQIALPTFSPMGPIYCCKLKKL